jgi:hypothetical protein
MPTPSNVLDNLNLKHNSHLLYTFFNYSLKCIDAKDYSHSEDYHQYTDSEINQELTKAFIGFSVDEKMNISTGRWGCGAFKGDW